MLLRMFSYLPVVLGSILIGSVTLLKNRLSARHVTFALFSIFLGLWHTFLFLGDISSDPQLALWWVRLATFFGTPMIASLIFFGVVFPEIIKKPSRRFLTINLILPISFMALALTPWLVPSVELRDGSAQPADLGIIYSLQSIYAVGGFIYAIYAILKKYRRVEKFAKAQIRLVTGGLLIALLVNTLTGFILTVLEASNNLSNLAGSISFLIFIGVTWYAVVRHRLFDIRLAIVRTIGFAITILLIGGAYTLLVIGVGAPIITDGEVSLVKNQASLFLLVPPTLVVAFTFNTIQQYVARATRRVFYQDLYDLREVLDRFSDSLIASNEIKEIMEKSLKVISDAIKPSHSYFVTFDAHGRVYRQISHKTKAPDSMSELIGDIKSINENPVVRETIEVSLPRSFEASDVFLVLRLGASDNPVGIILFGAKQNGRSYTAQDIDLLRIGAKNLSIALENAKHYDQISHFAETLRGEVLKATTDLRAANKELKTLDTMKDDFISMASHQLRTPATSVHEALQMMNHSEMKLTAEEKRRLAEMAEASSEHLVTVVADMLSISRIQAGHFTITRVPTNLVDVVDRVLRQTAVLAEQKKIKISFDKPATPITVSIDTPKINEAVSNYVENAIKYSPESTTVTVKLLVEEEKVRLEVSDQGIGVPEVERKKLFGKFYRAGNARTMQPDGNGIGLFVVKSIAEGHDGDAYYKPLDSGSLFGFWLPLDDQPPPTKHKPSKTPK